MVKKINTMVMLSTLCLLLAYGCSDKKGNLQKPVAIPVATAFVTVSDGNGAISYSGTIEESESTPLSFRVPGVVEKVHVSEGEAVRKGQLLATLNNESFSNSYYMALASEKQAEDAYKRMQPMYKNGTLPEIKFVEIETALQQARAAAAIAKKNLDDCKLYAPMAGRVGKRSAEPGMSGLPGVPALSIVKIQKVFARIAVSENEITQIKDGSKAEIQVPAIAGLSRAGVVQEIGVVADPIAHTYKVKIAIDNNDELLKPGMICNVLLKERGREAAMVIPEQAVMVDEHGINYVYTVTGNNKVSKRVVAVDKPQKYGIAVKSGLATGDEIVIEGQHKLFENALVAKKTK